MSGFADIDRWALELADKIRAQPQIVTTQTGMSVECQCPQCVLKREAAEVVEMLSAIPTPPMWYPPPGMSVQCAECQFKREVAETTAWYAAKAQAETPDCTEKEARELWGFLTRAKHEAVLSPDSISKIWGMLPDEPKDEPIAPPPINWLTHQKPLTDTVPQRAAFLKKEGLACPTEITPDDIDIFGRVSR